MSEKQLLQVGISWWNTGLSPLGKSRANDDEKIVAYQLVDLMSKKMNIDFLAFGEITTDDLVLFKQSCNLDNYTVFEGTLKQGHLCFDTGALYNHKRLKVIDSKYIVSSYGLQTLKIAQRVDLSLLETNERLHIYVLHWPSRLWCSENNTSRDALGYRLYDAIDELKKQSQENENAQIIVLGDFNDEPFSDSLAGHLLATRDRSLVRINDKFLYNPFWRLLGETKPNPYDIDSASICGTYHHQTGNITKWRTFDQILVSSSLVKNDRWFIEEERTKILDFPKFEELLRLGKVVFDHRPILCYIQRNIAGLSKEV
jgi:hypothetical protein